MRTLHLTVVSLDPCQVTLVAINMSLSNKNGFQSSHSLSFEKKTCHTTEKLKGKYNFQSQSSDLSGRVTSAQYLADSCPPERNAHLR